MFIGRLALFFAMFFGLVATQAPEYMQQYRQRLGGAIDELTTIVANFDADAGKQSLTEAQGIQRLYDNPDPFAQANGTRMAMTIGRLHRLIIQRDKFDSSGPVGRFVALASDVDPRVAERAYESFQPGLPASIDSVIAGLVGFFVGGGLIHLVGWPVRRLGWGRRRLMAQGRHEPHRVAGR